MILRRFPRRDRISVDQRLSPFSLLPPMAHGFLGRKIWGKASDTAPSPPPPWTMGGCYTSLYLTSAQVDGHPGKCPREVVHAPRKHTLGILTSLQGRGGFRRKPGPSRSWEEDQTPGRDGKGLWSEVTRGTTAGKGCWREEGEAGGPPGGRGPDPVSPQRL